eukprot:908-Heterococcus_DN1.PRE.2
MNLNASLLRSKQLLLYGLFAIPGHGNDAATKEATLWSSSSSSSSNSSSSSSSYLWQSNASRACTVMLLYEPDYWLVLSCIEHAADGSLNNAALCLHRALSCCAYLRHRIIITAL